MNGVFLAGQQINAVVPVTNEFGDALPVVEIQYRLIDHNDAILIASTNFEGYVSGDQEIEIQIPADKNVLTSPNTREVRVLDVWIKTTVGIVRKSFEYIIEAESVLVENVNSFMAYGKCVLTASEIPRLVGWNDATKEERITALIRARMNICSLCFKDCVVRDLKDDEWASLDKEFKDALRRAQVIEADFLLGGDERGEFRRQGVMSMTNGESKQFFRPAAPIEGVVCKAAMKELARWVVTTKKIART